MRYRIYKHALLRILLGIMSLPAALGAAYACDTLWGCRQTALLICLISVFVLNGIMALSFMYFRRCPKCGARALTIAYQREGLEVAPYWATCRRCGVQMITDMGSTALNGLPVPLRSGEGE